MALDSSLGGEAAGIGREAIVRLPDFPKFPNHGLSSWLR
jgi:hypothetical protein